MPLGSAWPEVAYTADELPTPLGEQLTDRLEAGESLERLFYVPANPKAPRRGFWARTRNVQVLAVTREQEKLREPRYGHTTLSLPRRRAASLAIRDEGNWLSLHYAPAPAVLDFPVATAHAPALRALVTALQSDALGGFGEDVLAQAFWNDVVLEGVIESSAAVQGTGA